MDSGAETIHFKAMYTYMKFGVGGSKLYQDQGIGSASHAISCAMERLEFVFLASSYDQFVVVFLETRSNIDTKVDQNMSKHRRQNRSKTKRFGWILGRSGVHFENFRLAFQGFGSPKAAVEVQDPPGRALVSPGSVQGRSGS